MGASAVGRGGKRSLKTLGVVIGGGFGAATLVGFLGGLWWPFDLASSFRPHYVVGLAVAVALLALAGDRRLVWVVLVGLAINLYLVVPLYIGSPAPPAGGTSFLRILTFNVSADNDNTAEVMDLFRSSNADLIFIFEGGPRWEEAINAADLPYDLSPGLPTAFGFGNAILIRAGLDVKLRGVSVGTNTPRARELDMEFDNVPIRLLAVHPPSPTSTGKVETRDQQLAGVIDWAADQDRPVVIVGDLNASPWSNAFRPLADSDLVNSMKGFGLQATWPAFLGPFGVPIDHLLHSAELTTVTRRTGPSLGSEHRSVFVTLARAAG